MQRFWTAFLGVLLFAVSAPADEGMWLFNHPPRKVLKEKYGFEPTEAWLGRLQRASVRFNNGGSGSFVSSDGLVMTNHHVAADALQKMSSADKDFLKLGFYAKTLEEEVKCVDQELNVLMSIEDVTGRVNAAVKADMPPAEAFKARRAVMSDIEKESADATGLRSDVVTLYQGGQYQLYRYKKYTDVRLVFAPEQAIAFFGGDPDNFEYPRYDLDVSFFRVYEDGKPAKIADFLPWNDAPPADGELVFVSGHPGRTERLNTLAHLEFLRDRLMPAVLAKLYRREVMLMSFSQRSPENARRAKDDLFGVQNSRKARLGFLAGLQDPAIMKTKQAEEAALRKAVAADPQLKDAVVAWDRVAETIAAFRDIYFDYDRFEMGSAFYSETFPIARQLVRIAEELEKPNGERLREYRDSNLESLRQQLFSEAPIYEDLEIVKLTDALSMLLENQPSSELVQKILAGKSPQDRAAELIRGSKLRDVATRKKIAEGGKKAIETSDDPMIRLALLVDAAARAVRKTFEEKVEEPQRQAYSLLAKARFAALGDSVYPDATFTLRLSFGRIAGFSAAGEKIPAWTTLGGTFEHARLHDSAPPFQLPDSWTQAKDRLAKKTPFNFISTPDIIGGNSGSPVVNRKGEVVGLIFDGNLESLPWDFSYSDAKGRAVSVNTTAITEALRKIYGAEKLADRLGR